MAKYHRDDSSHYLDRRELLEVDCHAKVVDVFRKLGARPRSAIIVCEHGRPERYVNGHHLATAYLEATKSDSSVYDLDVRTFLDSPRLQSKALAQVRMAPEVADVNIAPGGQLLEVGTNDLDRTVFLVYEQGEHVGYLFSHETFKGEADTPPPRFVCIGPVPHTNKDPDTGTCYYCPFPVGAATP